LAQEAAILKNHITEGRLLDIGCDLGDLFRWFPNPSWQRFGVELLPSAAAYASKTYNAQVFTGAVQQANFTDAFFDLVTMIDMLYYVDDPRADLEEVKRIIKPGGLLAIELAGQTYQLLRSRGLLCWLLDHRWTRLSTDSSYLYWFSPDGLEKLLSICGFRIASTYIVGSPTSPSFLYNYLAEAYRTFISVMFHVSHRWLTWAPKYLLIAESKM
jgi:ubiquinone/menaquinone biosynthesis C-methylase UbiE